MELILQANSLAKDLACSNCGTHYSMEVLQGFSECCGKPLLTCYHEHDAPKRGNLGERVTSMWRYAEMLPVFDAELRVTLGEGMTPILPLKRIGAKYGFGDLWIKDEGMNPTGSFKSRGMSVAVSKAKELGVNACVIPTAGNAGGAMSAYCAAAEIDAKIIMPAHTPRAFIDECRFYGSEPILVDGLIDKCGELAGRIEKQTGAFNMSTLKEPYRLEGKKTMGFEIAEQMNWELPDVIIYPTGGGTGLIGIWKAFQEMISIGWLGNTKLPRMIVIQSKNCAPMVDFINETKDHVPYGKSLANGLAVPKAFGQDLIRKTIHESQGCAVAVSEQKIIGGALELAKLEGISFSPEGGATWAGLQSLIETKAIHREEKILLINTGNSSKYMENLIL